MQLPRRSFILGVEAEKNRSIKASNMNSIEANESNYRKLHKSIKIELT